MEAIFLRNGLMRLQNGGLSSGKWSDSVSDSTEIADVVFMFSNECIISLEPVAPHLVRRLSFIHFLLKFFYKFKYSIFSPDEV